MRRMVGLMMLAAVASAGAWAHHKDGKAPAADAGAAVIAKLEHDFDAATQARGVDGWMEFMAENAVEGGAKPAVGRDAVRAATIENLKGGKLTWAPTHTEMFKGGAMGCAIGRWTFTPDDPKAAAFHGTYVTIWQKQKDGSWKVIYDAGTGDPAVGKK